MKRQLGPILAALALLCGPAVWAQSGPAASSTSSSSTSIMSSDPMHVGGPMAAISGDPVQAGGAGQSSGPAVNMSNDPMQVGGPTVSTSNDPMQVGGGSQQDAAQQDASQQDSSQTGSDDNGTNAPQASAGPQSTFNHPEELPALNMVGDAVAHTGIRFNLTTGTLVEYLSGGAAYGGYWDNLSLFSGGVGIVQVHPTIMWALNYNGGVATTTTFNQGSNYSTLNQTINGRVIWRLSRRWQMKAKDTYLYSDNPFEPYLTYISEPEPNNPNPSIYIPLAVLEQNQGSVDLTYQLGPHDSLDFFGAESFQRYLRGSFEGLWNSFTYTGGGFYQHDFSAKFSAGGGYTFSALDFGHGESRAGVQMFEGFVGYKFNKRMNLSAWIGPELTNTKDIIPIFCSQYGCLVEIMHSSQWDVAEGVNFGYVTQRQSVRLQFSHRVTDGGGILGAVELYQVSAIYTRPLNRLWGFSAGFLYSNNNSISQIRQDQYLYNTQGTVNFSRRISDDWNASLYYVFIHQSQNYYGLPAVLSTSGIGVTLRYSWGHSLGR